MCRWLAYSGPSIPMAGLVSRPEHSLIHQSREAALSPTAVNADGFGIGWYSPTDPTPAVFRSIQPAWADANLADLASHVWSGLFLAHVRASTGTAVQLSNCHPFRHKHWLWVHNGSIEDFARLKRDLVLAIDSALYPAIAGTTDSEVMFYLALTFGLEDDPVSAVERMLGLVERVGQTHGVPAPVQMTVATTDGQRIWAFRYSTEGRSRTLFYTADVTTVAGWHSDLRGLGEPSTDTRLVVSEPLFHLPDAWLEVPESSFLIVQPGADAMGSLTPRAT
jgi:predicted glutamine amidotransferase